MSKFYIILSIIITSFTFSKETDLKFDVSINSNKQIVIMVKPRYENYNKEYIEKLLKELNLTEEDFIKLNISIDELKKMDKKDIQKLLLGDN